MNKHIIASLVLLGCSLHAVESRIEIRNREAAGVGYSTGYTSLDYSLITDGPVEFLLDLRGHVFNNGQGAGNAGFGFRCPIKDEKFLVGANAFYDIRQSKGLFAMQAGAGFEALSKNVDFRTNGYLPIGKKKHLETKEFESFSGTSVLIKRKLKSTLPCIDAEVGTPLPRPFYFAIGGYYLFKQSESSLAVGNAFGVKARAEVDIGRYVSLGFAITYDRIFKTRPQGYISINIPFGTQKCKKRSYDKVCDTYYRNLRRVPIVRNEIIPIQDVKKTKDPLVIKGDDPIRFFFVNNLMTVPGDGSFEKPFATLKEAETNSSDGDVIYVFPGDNTARNMDEGIILKDNQILASSGARLAFNDIIIPPHTPGIHPVLTNINPGQPVIVNPGNTRLDDFFFIPPWEYIWGRGIELDPFAEARDLGFEVIEQAQPLDIDDFVLIEPERGAQPLDIDDFVIVDNY